MATIKYKVGDLFQHISTGEIAMVAAVKGAYFSMFWPDLFSPIDGYHIDESLAYFKPFNTRLHHLFYRDAIILAYKKSVE